MTYPGRTAAPDQPACPAQPELPRDRGAACWPTGRTTTPSGPSVEQREAGADGANEFVFYDGPPFANGLPHYGHLLTGYVKDLVPRYQTMRGRRVERRFGWDIHGLPAEVEAERQLGITDQAGDRRDGHRRVQRRVPHSRCCAYTQEWQRLRHPPGPLGRLRQRLQDPRPRLHGVASCGRSRQLHDKGLVYEGFRVLPYCWHDETPLSNHELRMDDDVYQDRQDPARHRRRPARDRRARRWSGRRPRGRCRRTWRSPSAPTSTTSSSSPTSPDGRALPPRRGRGWRRTTRELGEDARGRTPAHRRRAGRPSLHPAVPLLRRRRERATGVLAADFVTTEDGTGIVHMAPGLRRGRPGALRRRRHRRPSCRSDEHGRSPPTVTDYAGLHVFDANPDHRRPQGGDAVEASSVTRHRAAAPRDLRPHLPALLALPQAARSTWRCRPGSCRSTDVPGPDGRAQPGDHLGARARQGRAVRQVARRTPATGRSAATGSGARRSRCGRATTRRTRASTSTARSTSSSATSACGPTDLHRPVIDELTRPNPDDPTGQSTMRRVPEVLDCWFESGSMPFAQVHYPFENAGVVRAPLPGRLHRRVHRPDPRLVLHAARAGHGAVRPAGVPNLRQPRHRARLRRPEDVEEPAQLPRRLRGVRPRRLRRDALVPDVVARSCAAATSSSPSRASATRCARCCIPLWNSWYFFCAVRQRRRLPAAGRDRLDRPARPLPAGQDARVRRAVTEQLDDYDVASACDSTRGLPRRADELVHPPLAGAVLGRRASRRARSTRSTPCSRRSCRRGGAAAAADHRGDLARPDRRARRCT